MHTLLAIALTLSVTHTPLLPSTPDAKQPDPPTKATMRVTLGDTFMIVEEPAGRVIRDFKTRRSYFTLDGKTQNVSLFAEVGGREVEMENREALAEMMQQGGVKDAAFSVVESEQDLSVRAAKSKTKIDRAEKDGVVHFTSQGKTLVEWSAETVPASDAERKEFVRFVRFEIGMHPSILEELAKSSGIPRRLHSHLMGQDIDVELVESKNVDMPSYEVPSSHSPLEDIDALAPILARVKPATLADVLRKNLDDAEVAVNEKRYLDAMLGYLENTFIIGRFPAEFSKHKDVLIADPTVQLFDSSMNPRNAAEAREALKRMAIARNATTRKKYVVQILEGDFHSDLHEQDEAMTNFVAALKEQPLITGVWKDMGEVYLRGFDAHSAWACWDVARSIAPQHTSLRTVTELEQHLLSAYPEFF